MQYKRIAALAFILLAHCQGLEQPSVHLTLHPRGSGSRSPSPSKSHDKATSDETAGLLGAVVRQKLTKTHPHEPTGLLGDVVRQRISTAPTHESTGLLGDVVRQGISKAPTHESTGLLGDVVHQAAARSAVSNHPSHPLQFHPGHSSQPLQARPAPLPHLTQAHSTHQLQPPQRLTAQQKQATQGPAGSRAQSTRSRSKKGVEGSGSSRKHQPLPRLRQLGASLHSIPHDVRKDPAHDILPATRKHTQRSWWKRPGGHPPSQQGAGTHYEASKKSREKKKLKTQGTQADDHPTWHPHHPSRGGGPGSPGAGGHALSRRALQKPES